MPVSQKIQTIIIDDLDGRELVAGEGRTIEFAYDGTSYSIDLSDKNAAAFDKAVSKYIEAGTKLGRAGRGSVTPMRRSAKNTDIDTQAVRSWAEANGYEISARGRIKGEIVEAFREAMA
jgi:nucleoid-associated protein Lsr2